MNWTVNMDPRLKAALHFQATSLPPTVPSAATGLPPTVPSAATGLPPAVPSAATGLPPAVPSAATGLPPAVPSAATGLPPAVPSAATGLPPAVPSAATGLPPAVPSAATGLPVICAVEHSYVLPSPTVMTEADINTNLVRCTQCSLSVLRKNLKTHLLRKHVEMPQDITQMNHLRSVCVDEKSGIFAVLKTRHGFSVPVHVQRKIWGETHQVRCELEECHQYHLLARRSGLGYSLCEHLRSIDYCRKTVPEIFLKEDILREMVSLKIFGEAKAVTCINRQKVAQAAQVPLAVMVEFGESAAQICLSIHESEIQSFCRLGRLFVTYNKQKNTWHCACAKPQTLCPHKSISEWFLFQTQRDFFWTKVPPSPGSPLPTSEDASGCLHNTAVEPSVCYMFKEEKIPQILSNEITEQKHKVEPQEQFVPVETMCQLCPVHLVLDKAVQVTNNAQIVSMMGLTGSKSGESDAHYGFIPVMIYH
ncbi:uncharacterized protein LOC125713150 isoform X2 [Brienomyrus brachyistius]|uniref:uncharacterized protein LOC125713150 isoform X2 n=1 Tax=Brienomyrus brachyistius TaxID=42636 RepID=UPI0020B41A1F|nr:uncharacterized protein LOC125713150 isoform X2 [Brienomyrus brachyistius]XP_048840058.1 uncharacterized protein LOC125713150 isoform X2 [Brienomyrus brachyistius]